MENGVTWVAKSVPAHPVVEAGRVQLSACQVLRDLTLLSQILHTSIGRITAYKTGFIINTEEKAKVVASVWGTEFM